MVFYLVIRIIICYYFHVLFFENQSFDLRIRILSFICIILHEEVIKLIPGDDIIYTLAICDDDIEMIEQLHKLIDAFDKTISIHMYTNPIELLRDYKHKHYDVVLLDIDMPELTGFELAKELKEVYNDVLIVFVTAKNQLISQSFKYRPISFIFKGNLEDLNFVFKDIEHELRLIHSVLQVERNNISYSIRINDIMYFEKNLNYIDINTINDKITVRMTLINLENMIDLSKFIRVSKSILVNKYYIRSVDYTNCYIALLDNKLVKFSRLYKKEIRGAL